MRPRQKKEVEAARAGSLETSSNNSSQKKNGAMP
jgi:hypothetical protein